MKIIWTILIAPLIVFNFTVAKAEKLNLPCLSTDMENPSLLKQAPSGAKRIDKDTLQVNWKNGTHLFKAVPPGDDAGSERGENWLYCGFNSTAKLHLLANKIDTSESRILNEINGEIILADLSVSAPISPNGKLIFSSYQPDGMDGQIWAIYDRNNIRVWEGASNITIGGPIIAFLEQPTWNAKGELQTKYSCVNSQQPPKKITLTGGAWTPEVVCPEN